MPMAWALQQSAVLLLVAELALTPDMRCSISRVCSLGCVPKYTGRRCPTEVLGQVRYGLITLPNIPVRFGTVRYELNTGTQHFREFGRTSIPVPDTSVSPVRLHFPIPDNSVRAYGGYLPYQKAVRYGLHTLPNIPVWFGTNSIIPLPDPLVTLVHTQ